MQTTKIPYALCAYSLPHTLGYLPTKQGEPNPQPKTLRLLLDAADEFALSGVEFSLASVVSSFDGKQLPTSGVEAEILEEIRERSLTLIADYGCILDHEAEHLTAYLQTAAQAGARTVRATLSHILCGDRRGLKGGWESYFKALVKRLQEVLPVAEQLGITLAVENHQDVTSADLIALFTESGQSSAFGVTLDTGNPLAVGEDPVEFTQRIAPIIRHLHLKDYTLHYAPEGYRLVRCAAGEGVIDFPAILAIVLSNGHSILPAIEIAAQSTRTIPILEQTWWDHFPADHFRHLFPALRLLWAKGAEQSLPYSSPWEQGADSETVVNEEWQIVRRSAAYFANIAPQ